MSKLDSKLVRESVSPGTDHLSWLAREAERDAQIREYFSNFIVSLCNEGSYSVVQFRTGLTLLNQLNSDRMLLSEGSWLFRAIQLFLGEVYQKIISSRREVDVLELLKDLDRVIDFRDLCHHRVQPQIVGKLQGLAKTVSHQSDLEFISDCLTSITMFKRVTA